MSEGNPIIWLLILGLPVACVSWTVTHEEIFAELREWCARRSARARTLAERKFFYVFTCEYCFSHYVAAVVVAVSGLRLVTHDWTGAVLGWLSVVWVANVYMSLFGRLRLDIKHEHLEVKADEQELERKNQDSLGA